MNGLEPPEVEGAFDFAALVEDPAEERAECGEQNGPGDRPRVILNHEVVHDIAGGEENRGIEEDREKAERQNVEGQGQEQKHGTDEGV